MPDKERLLKLADHLRNGKLGHKVFDFSVWNEGATYGHPCGTRGCAIGEMPVIDPEKWTWLIPDSGSGYPSFRRTKIFPVLKGHEDVTESGCIYFDISEKQFNMLFTHTDDRTVDSLPFYGMATLAFNATKEQVAANIEAFVKIACV